MTFKPSIWYPIAVVLTVANLLGVGFAARPGEPWHATIHAGLALAFGLWARRLRQARGDAELSAGGEVLDRLEALEGEVNGLRNELGEVQERLDFTERLLAQGQEARGLGPQR